MKRTWLLLLVLLITACSNEPRYWYADVTEWLIGLPADNICETTQPMWLSPSKDSHLILAGPKEAMPYSTAARKLSLRPTMPVVKEGRRVLLYKEPHGETEPLQALPKGTRVELLSAWLEKVESADAAPLYAIYAELRLLHTDETVWAALAWHETPKTLPLLAAPTTHKALSLELENALKYVTKRSIPRPVTPPEG